MTQIRAAGIGSIIAVIVLVVVIVLWIIGRLDPITAGLIGALAIARLT